MRGKRQTAPDKGDKGTAHGAGPEWVVIGNHASCLFRDRSDPVRWGRSGRSVGESPVSCKAKGDAAALLGINGLVSVAHDPGWR